MSPPLLLALIGVLYILVFGGLALFRRERLPTRSILEGAVLTALVAGLAATTSIEANPVLFLVVIYCFTMRVRLLVDLGNLTARNGRHATASRLYGLAARLWPDDANLASVQINRGVLSLDTGKLDEAIETFRAALQLGKKDALSLKQESGCRYNLGVAYERKGMGMQARAEFEAVLDVWPGSEFARRAVSAIERLNRQMAGGPGRASN